MIVRFRERMVGPVAPVDRIPWTLPRRGPAAADGVREVAASVRGRCVRSLDLDALHVEVEGIGPDDGYTARVVTGLVSGIETLGLPVAAGFADVLELSDDGRRMHYRLLVEHRGRSWVVEGVKTVRGGVRGAFAATTTLATILVRVDDAHRPEADRQAEWLADGGIDGVVVAAGLLRVRGLLAQAVSMRGRVLPFLAGFVRRVLVVR